MMWTVFSLVLVSSFFVLKSKSAPFSFLFLLHLHFLPQAWLSLFAVLGSSPGLGGFQVILCVWLAAQNCTSVEINVCAGRFTCPH